MFFAGGTATSKSAAFGFDDGIQTAPDSALPGYYGSRESKEKQNKKTTPFRIQNPSGAVFYV